MTRIRLLPVVVLAIAALLVLKTMGLVTNGGYLLTGVATARASGASSGAGEGGSTTEADHSVTPAVEPTLEDTSPTLSDGAPTLGEQPEAAGGHGAAATEAPAGDHGAAAEGAAPTAEGTTPVAASTTGTYCVEPDATITESGEAILRADPSASEGHGEAPSTGNVETAADAEGAGHVAEGAIVVPEGSFAAAMIDCLPSGDAIPMEIGPDGQAVALGTASDNASGTDQQLLERLVARRTELQQYEQDLALRASIVDAAEKRIEERAATLEALEGQISTLVDQRQEMESGQFVGIVAMYENMRPKDAANIFNNLDMAVLLQVAKTMAPRKMAPILAAMDPPRAQELTVQMANLSAQPPAEMTPEDLAALPQIVGQ